MRDTPIVGGCAASGGPPTTMGPSMSLLDRLSTEHLDTAREPVGAVGAALSGAGAALLSLLGVALPVLLTWAVSPDTAATWGQAVRVSASFCIAVSSSAVGCLPGRASIARL